METERHKFLQVYNSETSRIYCANCHLGPEAEVHQTMSVDEYEMHTFINAPGATLCQYILRKNQMSGFICGQHKDHPSHIKTSDQDTTYRKPLALRFDLIPPIAIRRLAAIYEEGAQVYGASKYISAPMPHSNVVKHLQNHLNLACLGDRTEDHWAKIAWAAFTMIVYEELGIGKADLAKYGVIPDTPSNE